VPPKHAVMARVTWQEYTITIPFRVKGMGKFASGVTLPISFNGVYEGIASSKVYVRKSPPFKEGEENRALEMLSDSPGEPLEMLADSPGMPLP
jgi:hypothetical protein